MTLSATSFVIQDAIDAAPPGSTVNVPPGVYQEQLVIDKPLTLSGPDPAIGEAVVDAAGMAAVPTIHIIASDVTVTRLTIQNGTLHGIVAGSADWPDLTNIVITNNIIRGHANAGILTANGAALHIENNIIENNGQGTGFNRVGILLRPHGPSQVIGNIIRNNAIDGIYAEGSDSGLLIEDNEIDGHDNSGITLAWDQVNTTIRNNLIANNGLGLSQETGGIVIVQSMAEEISGNIIRNSNGSGIHWGWTPSFGPAPEEVLIVNNVITDSNQDGIFLFSQGPGGFIPPDPFPLEPLVCGNTLQNNGRAGVYVSNVYYYSPGNASPAIHFNSISGNEAWGVFNGTAGVVDAADNWWGNPSGPFHPTLNPDGTGDPVSDNVEFDPWLTGLSEPTVLGCELDPVILESATITPMRDEKASVRVGIRVNGRVLVDVNGEESTLPFYYFLSKSMVMYAPDPEQIKVSILPQTACDAFPESQWIHICVFLFVVVSIESEVQLMVPSYGYPPRPPQCAVPQCPTASGAGRNQILPDAVPAYVDVITTSKVFDRCRFRENIDIRLAVPPERCPLLDG